MSQISYTTALEPASSHTGSSLICKPFVLSVSLWITLVNNHVDFFLQAMTIEKSSFHIYLFKLKKKWWKTNKVQSWIASQHYRNNFDSSPSQKKKKNSQLVLASSSIQSCSSYINCMSSKLWEQMTRKFITTYFPTLAGSKNFSYA